MEIPKTVIELLRVVQDISIPLFSVTSMLAVGLRYTARDLLGPLREPRHVIQAVGTNFVLIPALAYLTTQLLDLEPTFETGLMVLASAAGAPVMLKLTRFAGGDLGLSATLLVLLLPLTLVYMPLVLPLLVPGADVSGGAIARPLLLNLLLPLVVGLLIRAWRPRWARRVLPAVGKTVNLTLWVLIVASILVNLEPIVDVFGQGAILAAFILIGGAFALGYLFSGPGRDERIVHGFGTAQRNIAAAMVVARQTFGAEAGVFVMVVVASTLSNLLIPLAYAMRRRPALPTAAAPGAGNGNPES